MRRLLIGLFMLALGCVEQTAPLVPAPAVQLFPLLVPAGTPPGVRLDGNDTLMIGDSLALLSGGACDRLTMAGATTGELLTLLTMHEVGTYARVVVWAGTAGCIRGEDPAQAAANLRALYDYAKLHGDTVALLSPVQPAQALAQTDCHRHIQTLLAAFPDMIDVSDWPTRYPDLFPDGLHTTVPIWEGVFSHE